MTTHAHGNIKKWSSLQLSQKKNPLITKKLKYGKVPHRTCSASTADEMELNLDFAFLESVFPLMLYMFPINATRMSRRTALHFP